MSPAGRGRNRCAVALLSLALVGLVPSCAVDPPGPRTALTPAQRAELDRHPALRSLRVAVVDGGIDDSHPSLSGVVIGRWVAPGLASGATAHGTQVAGIVAGRPTAAYGGGLAPQALILDVKVLEADGTGDPADLAAGLAWAQTNRADILVTSLALESDDPTVRAAVDDITSSGTPLVAAAGNGIDDAVGRESGPYPVAYPGVIGATASRRDGGLLTMARTRAADVLAPGDRISAPTPGPALAEVSGTSIAAAIVAGMLAGCGAPPPENDTALSTWTGERVDIGGADIGTVSCPRPTA